MTVDLPDVDALVAGATSAHSRLRETISSMTDEIARQPSLLPDWSVGHVLTHIARNADSHTRMLDGAIAGEQRVQYPGGNEQRAADIEAGAGRPAAELVADVRDSCDRLEATWTAMTAEAWAGGGVRADGSTWPAPLIVAHRWREVEIHHADLGLGYGPADWDDAYVATELARQLSVLPARLDPADRRQLLAWLMGRRDQPTLDLPTGTGAHFLV